MNQVLPYLTALCAVGTFVLALYLALRNQLWRDDDGRASRDAKTGERIDRIDATARASIERVERELLDKQNTFGDRLTRLEERVQHLPTAKEIAALTDRVGEMEAQLAGMNEKVGSTQEMVRTIRDHIFQRERS